MSFLSHFWKIDISFAQICIALGQAKREHNFDRHLCNSFLGGWPIFRESRRSLCYKWSCSKLFHKFRARWLLISDSQIKWLWGLSVEYFMIWFFIRQKSPQKNGKNSFSSKCLFWLFFVATAAVLWPKCCRMASRPKLNLCWSSTPTAAAS